MLKRLRGTPIVRHDNEFGMVYSPHPPYEVLQTREIDFATMQRMRRFGRYWDLIANSGNFIETTPMIWSPLGAAGEGGDGSVMSADGSDTSPLWSFLRLSDWLHETAGRTHAIALKDLAKLLHDHLTTVRRQRADVVSQAVWRDYQRGGRSDMPEFLRGYVTPADTRVIRRPRSVSAPVPPRQARHLRG
jgi:hypothetical protein